jgi:hypothetical protein
VLKRDFYDDHARTRSFAQQKPPPLRYGDLKACHRLCFRVLAAISKPPPSYLMLSLSAAATVRAACPGTFVYERGKISQFFTAAGRLALKPLR